MRAQSKYAWWDRYYNFSKRKNSTIWKRIKYMRCRLFIMFHNVDSLPPCNRKPTKKNYLFLRTLRIGRRPLKDSWRTNKAFSWKQNCGGKKNTKKPMYFTSSSEKIIINMKYEVKLALTIWTDPIGCYFRGDCSQNVSLSFFRENILLSFASISPFISFAWFVFFLLRFSIGLQAMDYVSVIFFRFSFW